MNDRGILVWVHCYLRGRIPGHEHRTIPFNEGIHHFCQCGYRV